MTQQKVAKYDVAFALLSLSQIAYLDAKKIYPQHTPIPLDEVKIGIDAAFDTNIAMGLDINTRTICDSINEAIDECMQRHNGLLPAWLGGGALNTLIAPDTTAHPPLNQWHIQ
jgi:hypothetical protein